ncbi:MAG: DUF4269 domain-containing protein [Gaiellales bacterium]
MIEDWYQRLQGCGLLDTLAPYQPALVGAYPLGVAAAGGRIEIVCRATDLAAFARLIERAYGDREGFGLYGGSLDGEEAVFAEFTLEGLPLEVSAQREHTHRRLAAATLGVARVLEQRGETARVRLAAAVAGGEDWLEAALAQTGLSRAAVESLSTANPALARRVLGVPGPAPALRQYVLAVLVGFVAMVLIALAGATRGGGSFTGAMFVVEAVVLGGVFGARLGMIASLFPLALIGVVVGGSILIGTEQCRGECGVQFATYVFVGVLVAGASGLAGAIRDRYFSRG